MSKQGVLVLSTLGHTWLLDLDGTIVKHNGYKLDGYDAFLEGAKTFLNSIPRCDMIIFLTSRKEEYQERTERFLRENGVRFDHIIYGLPYGERILMNDRKCSGLDCAIALSNDRDVFEERTITLDSDL